MVEYSSCDATVAVTELKSPLQRSQGKTSVERRDQGRLIFAMIPRVFQREATNSNERVVKL